MIRKIAVMGDLLNHKVPRASEWHWFRQLRYYLKTNCAPDRKQAFVRMLECEQSYSSAILSSQEFPAAHNITYAEVYSVGERVQASLLLNVSEATISFLRLLARFVHLRHVRGSPPVVEFAACPGLSNRRRRSPWMTQRPKTPRCLDAWIDSSTQREQTVPPRLDWISGSSSNRIFDRVLALHKLSPPVSIVSSESESRKRRSSPRQHFTCRRPP